MSSDPGRSGRLCRLLTGYLGDIVTAAKDTLLRLGLNHFPWRVAGALEDGARALRRSRWSPLRTPRPRRPAEPVRPATATRPEREVYVAVSCLFGYVKIGCAPDARARVAALSTGCPGGLRLACSWKVEGSARKCQFAIHEALSEHRFDGEFFRLPERDAVVFVDRFLVHWKGGD